MIDAAALGKLLVEDAINPEGPCLYPGKFHPPHVGHCKAAINLASRNYVTEVIIVISAKVSPETGNITPEQALLMWQLYLDAQPNAKIKVKISEYDSPYNDMNEIIKKNPKTPVFYVAGGDDEVDDQHYIESLQKEYGNRVRSIKVHEKDGDITAPRVRSLVQQRNYEEFKKVIPIAAYNNGAAPKIWKILTGNIPEQQPTTTIDKGQGTDKTLH